MKSLCVRFNPITALWRVLPLAVALLGAPVQAAGPDAAVCPALLDRTVLRLQDEKPQSLCQYRGKVLLVVNTASFCGFTPQYKALEALHAKYAARGFVVLGFPSNDFGQQEPGSNKEIAAFCESTFGVKFPMFSKTTVKGPKADPLFADLTQRSGSAPGWNFHKYLVARDGATVAAFASEIDPAGRSFVAQVEKLLDAR